MKKPTTISKESVSEYREFVQLRLRKRVLEAIEVVLEEEVDQAVLAQDGEHFTLARVGGVKFVGIQLTARGESNMLPVNHELDAV